MQKCYVVKSNDLSSLLFPNFNFSFLLRQALMTSKITYLDLFLVIFMVLLFLVFNSIIYFDHTAITWLLLLLLLSHFGCVRLCTTP